MKHSGIVFVASGAQPGIPLGQPYGSPLYNSPKKTYSSPLQFVAQGLVSTMFEIIPRSLGSCNTQGLGCRCRVQGLRFRV